MPLTNEARSVALGTPASSCSTGIILGPAIGGWLAMPADKYPQLFAQVGGWMGGWGGGWVGRQAGRQVGR
jgi:hypothetical protein